MCIRDSETAGVGVTGGHPAPVGLRLPRLDERPLGVGQDPYTAEREGALGVSPRAPSLSAGYGSWPTPSGRSSRRGRRRPTGAGWLPVTPTPAVSRARWRSSPVPRRASGLPSPPTSSPRVATSCLPTSTRRSRLSLIHISEP